MFRPGERVVFIDDVEEALRTPGATDGDVPEYEVIDVRNYPTFAGEGYEYDLTPVSGGSYGYGDRTAGDEELMGSDEIPAELYPTGR